MNTSMRPSKSVFIGFSTHFVAKNVNYEDRRYRLVSTGNTYKVDSMLLPKEANRPLRVQKDLQTAKQLIELLDHAKVYYF